MDENSLRKRMEEVLGLTRSDVSSIRTGRATSSLVQDIVVGTYGGGARLKIVELGTIASPDPHTIVITPWDRATLLDIKRAIEEADVGLNPIVDGEVIRINLPGLTAEDRQNYVRILHQKLESGRIMIRRIRQEAMGEVEETFERKEFGEDEKFLRKEKIQKLTDEYIEKIEELGKQKEQELLSV